VWRKLLTSHLVLALGSDTARLGCIAWWSDLGLEPGVEVLSGLLDGPLHNQ
ncbi:hypothetical protein KUCAC02_035749, partial [Chaenocephalus aceratus]